MSHEQRANSFLFEPLAFLNDLAVLAMNEAEVGTYIVLLLSAWQLPEPGVIPDDDRILAILSRTGDRWPAYREKVSAAFDLASRPGFWVQKRMVGTKKQQDRFVEKQRSNGRLGGRPKNPTETNTKPRLETQNNPDVSPSGSGSGSGSGSEKQVKGRVKGTVPAARSRFVPPTLEELESYLRDRHGLGRPEVNASAFLAHYESNGWKVGRNPMVNWKAAVVTWEKNDMRGARVNGADKSSRGRKIMEFGAKLKAEEARGEQS